MVLGDRNRFQGPSGGMKVKGPAFGIMDRVRRVVIRALGREVEEEAPLSLTEKYSQIRTVQSEFKCILGDDLNRFSADFFDPIDGALYKTTDKVLGLCESASSYRIGDDMKLREPTEKEEFFEKDAEELISDYLDFLTKYKRKFSLHALLGDDTEEVYKTVMKKKYIEEFEIGIALFEARVSTLNVRFKSINGDDSWIDEFATEIK